MTPTDALKNIQTLVDEAAALKDDMLRKVVLRRVIVVAQKGLGIAPDGVAEPQAQ
jgi:hypothetical protein